MGGFILFVKGYSLLKEANNLYENIILIILVLILTLFTGLLKNKYIMSKFCRKNLRRITTLESPKIYQFFTPGFLFALFVMILTGLTLSKLAIGNYNFMLAVGGLDLSLSVALLSSSIIFIKEKV
jgi:hypothetical protein